MRQDVADDLSGGGRLVAELIDRALDEARHLKVSDDELTRLFHDRVTTFKKERERRKVRDD